MKLLFLDFDGVLNSGNWYKRRPSKDAFAAEHNISPEQFSHDMGTWALRAIDPDAVAALNQIVHRSRARVVVSSTWRSMWALPKLENFLRQRGFEHHLIGTTCDASWVRERGDRRVSRGEEIQRWLDLTDHTAKDAVILDDDSDMDQLTERLFQTHHDIGLIADHVDQIVRMWQ